MRFQFSIRAALVAVALLAPVSYYLADYWKKRPDFVLPSPAEYAALVKAQQAQRTKDGIVVAKKKASAHGRALRSRCPPLGIEYWQERAKQVEPGMHELALYRYLPSQTIGTSFLLAGKGTQVAVYAVDSELAAICEVTIEAGSGLSGLVRVVKFHGFANHNLAFDEWGSLDAEKLTFDDDGQFEIVFGDDGV